MDRGRGFFLFLYTYDRFSVYPGVAASAARAVRGENVRFRKRGSSSCGGKEVDRSQCQPEVDADLPKWDPGQGGRQPLLAAGTRTVLDRPYRYPCASWPIR